ncbi:MAG: histidinol-phosphate transaminase [Caloramator sp.]|uniref:histidinol-phosphate transaminase n=1 Tax=Caloramator sp. TaxID=1871330 RepID=UPI001DB3FD5A|nr:histidinol-phosphate transaminase [Caloramator sp.]MBZ4662461.1 histidinol-phosphate transaminase [Caloramator sp.]
MKVREAIKGVRPYQAGKPISEVKRQLGLVDIIKLASNENPYGCSEKVKKAMYSAVDSINLYPDASNYELKKALAEHIGVKPSMIFCGTGSDLLIRVLCSVFIDKDDEIIMGDISFQRYEDSAKIMGGKVIKVKMKDYRLDVEAMVNAITDKTKIIWFATPNNPIGTIVKRNELLWALENIPDDIIVVIDEAYREYVNDKDYPETVPLLDKYKNIVILRTFSKAYGLAGLRLGYGIASEEITQYMNSVIGPFDTNLIAQEAGIAALQDKEFLKFVVEKNEEGRQYYYKEFNRLGLKFIESQANFVMVDTGKDDMEVFNKLLRKGVIVRPGSLFDMPGWLRVTVGTMEQCQRFVKSLEEIIRGE